MGKKNQSTFAADSMGSWAPRSPQPVSSKCYVSTTTTTFFSHKLDLKLVFSTLDRKGIVHKCKIVSLHCPPRKEIPPSRLASLNPSQNLTNSFGTKCKAVHKKLGRGKCENGWVKKMSREKYEERDKAKEKVAKGLAPGPVGMVQCALDEHVRKVALHPSMCLFCWI
jgi:hypothetical protein